MNKQARFHVAYWLIAVLGVLAIQHYIGVATQVAQIPYSEFERLLRDGKITEVGI